MTCGDGQQRFAPGRRHCTRTRRRHAILAGDGLLTLAFDIISRDRSTAIRRAPAADAGAGAASGIGGMVGGQMLDLAGEGGSATGEPVDVARLQQMKTGALLR